MEKVTKMLMIATCVSLMVVIGAAMYWLMMLSPQFFVVGVLTSIILNYVI